MMENSAIIKEIIELRKEIKDLRMLDRQEERDSSGGGNGGGSGRQPNFTEQEARKMVEMQRRSIELLRDQVDAAQARVGGHVDLSKPASRDKLPPGRRSLDQM